MDLFQSRRLPLQHHAIVIGGGIAGMLAARVLLNHFEQVSLIERNIYPPDPAPRSGAPQGSHVHILYLRGQRVIEALFPGISEKLVNRGALSVDFSNDYLYHFPVGWLPREPSQMHGYVCTRVLLEWQLLQELKACPRLHILQGCEVVGLMASPDRLAVRGVYLKQQSTDTAPQQQHDSLSADLVVDASGRFSHAVRWLQALHYPCPTETVIDADVGYATRAYAPSIDPQRTWKGVMIQSNPPENLRTGFIWSVEQGRWLVLLVGAGKDYPPIQEADFLEFAQGLADPFLFDVVSQAQPLSPIYSYRRTENRLRHFERLKRQPAGFIVLGDACCALNPMYGQGMTVAAMAATVLDTWLTHNHGHIGGHGRAHQFQKRLARINALPWQFAITSDYRVPGTGAPKSNWLSRLQASYTDTLMTLLPTDAAVRNAFMQVLHMTHSPAILLRPAFLLKALRTGRQKDSNNSKNGKVSAPPKVHSIH